MRIIDLDFYADKGSAIFLGYAGEHLSTVLNFHMPAELGNNDCIYVINFLKDGESSSNIISHFAYKTKFNTNIVEYYIPSSIMGNNTSSGVFQLVAYGMTTTIGNKVKYSILGKSTEFHYVIDNAITTDTSNLTIELSESESLALQDLIEAISRLGNIETQFNELDGLTNALGTFIEKGDVAYTFDSTTTNVTYNATNPKIIYTNAVVNNKNAFVFTTANNYYQLALCYDGTEYKRELTSGGSTTYKSWALVNNENTGNKKTTLTGNESSNEFYPTTKAVADALNTKADSSALTAKADVTYVDNRLNTKADVTYVDNRVEEVGDLNSALNYSQGYYNGVEIIKGGYIVTNGSTADPTEIVPNEAWCHSVLSASESDVFTISGSGGVNPRLWCFIDASNNVLSVSQSNYTDNFIEIVAPENANKLIFNTRNNVNYGIYRGKLVKREIADLQFNLSVQQKGTYIMPNTKIRQGTYYMGNFDNNDLTRICLEETSVNSGRIFVHPGNICTAFNILTFTEDSYATTGWLTNDYSVSINDTIRFSVVFRKTDPSENISPSEYDATVSITSYLQDQINSDTSKNIIVATYNEGAFEGDDYEQGSDALAIQYRRAVAELNANIVFVQDDVRYFNATEQSLPRNEVFAMFPNYYVNNGGSLNYIGWASDYSLHDLGYVSLENYHGHPRFYTAKVYVKGTTLYLLNVHLDWYDKELRQAQIREIISYITTNQLTHVIIAGDMNPSVRENGQFPSGTSHTHNYSNSDEDYAIWTSAGFKVCNGGYFGDYMTDITYSDADDGGAKAAWDNIIVSNDIDIKRVGTIIKPYMNDHVPFFAELVIK